MASHSTLHWDTAELEEALKKEDRTPREEQNSSIIITSPEEHLPSHCVTIQVVGCHRHEVRSQASNQEERSLSEPKPFCCSSAGEKHADEYEIADQIRWKMASWRTWS